MKKEAPLLVRVFLGGMALVMAISCATNPQTRIDKHPTAYGKLSPKHQKMVERGAIEEGMSKDAVYLAWGSPERVKKGSRGGETYETWEYEGYDAVWRSDLYYGYGHYDHYGYYGHYHCPGYYGGYKYIPYVTKRVVFAEGKVKEWEHSR